MLDTNIKRISYLHDIRYIWFLLSWSRNWVFVELQDPSQFSKNVIIWPYTEQIESSSRNGRTGIWTT